MGDASLSLAQVSALLRSTQFGASQLPLCPSGTARANTVCRGDDPRLSGGAITLAAIIAAIGNQSANLVLAGPVSGGAATTSFRLLVLADIPWPVTTKGDILTFSTVPTRLPVGTNGQIIIADSTQPLGLRYADATGGVIGFTSGKDRNRPSASASAVYLATDTNQQYFSNLSNWWVGGKGRDITTLGRPTGGFDDSSFFQGPTGAATAPTMVPSYTFCIGFQVISLPGTTRGVMFSYGTGNITAGWVLSSSATNSNKLRIDMIGLGTVSNELTAATLTTGFHVFCINYSGSALRYCMDGGAVTNVVTTGTYTIPNSSSVPMLGRYCGSAGFACPWMDFGFMQGYASLLSDADMQALGGNLTNKQPGLISTDPAYDLQSRWALDGGTAAGSPALQAYGTASSTLTSLSAQGAGIFKTTF